MLDTQLTLVQRLISQLLTFMVGYGSEVPSGSLAAVFAFLSPGQIEAVVWGVRPITTLAGQRRQWKQFFTST
jgi:hypothetical protein